MNVNHLMRTRYKTDYKEGDAIGTFSSAIPDNSTTKHIVDVDWESDPGYVWVTFLVAGDSYVPSV